MGVYKVPEDMIGLAVILKNEYPLIDTFIYENEIFDLFSQIVFVDDFSDDGSYEKLSAMDNVQVYRRYLDYNFSRQRNFAASFLNTNYICRIDLDEQMNDATKQYIRDFKNYLPPGSGKGKDFYQIYRNEIIDGKLKETSEQPFIYWNSPRIYWVRTVHEWLVGYETKGFLLEECRLLHNKTSSRYTRQNQFYHDNFEEHRQITHADL